MEKSKRLRRRDFLKHSAVTAGGVTLAGQSTPKVWAKGSDNIRVGVIGCGGRGTGAANNCVEAADGVEIVALADVFEDRLKKLKDKFKVPKTRCFTGLDGYRKLLDLDDINLVILGTPPAFRPQHFEAAINKGKNVFMEKPVAVCLSGIKKVMETSKKAAEKKLAVVAGTQRRHQKSYIETMKRIHDGAIGEIVSAQCYWNQGGLWVKKREKGQSDIEWQLRNWLYFTWLSGDHIVEQHVHNIDVINWAIGALPDSVHGCGGRQQRTAPEYGNIYDHFGIEFFYPSDTQKELKTISMCRQIQGASRIVGERVVGTKGVSDCRGTIEGEKPWKFSGDDPDPYVQEHTDLIKSIRAVKPLNEGQRIAESTLCAIMARESAYTRQQFKRTWFMAKATLNHLPPENLRLSGSKKVDPVAIPGIYKFEGLVIEPPKQKKKKNKNKKSKKKK